MPAKVEVYGKEGHENTQKALDLLTDKGAPFVFLDVDRLSGGMDEVLSRGGRTRLPQVFVNNRPVGSWEDLHELEAKGDLGEWLATRFQQS